MAFDSSNRAGAVGGFQAGEQPSKTRVCHRAEDVFAAFNLCEFANRQGKRWCPQKAMPYQNIKDEHCPSVYLFDVCVFVFFYFFKERL